MKGSASTSAPFDFLRSYVEKVLDDSGFANMPEETRAQYVPQFVAEAERRLGLALLPKLNEASAKELAALGSSESVTSEALQQFWQNNVPDFSDVVQKTLADFAGEMKSTLAGLPTS
jgi:hypothetical protein